MRVRVAVAALCFVVLAVVAVRMLRGREPAAAVTDATAPTTAARRAAPLTVPFGWSLPGLSAPEPAVEPEALRQLDCEAPAGDVALVDAGRISAASFCAELRQLSGGAKSSASASVSPQARQLLEQLIDAALVDAALAAEGASVTPDEIDAALERLQPPGSTLSLEEFLRGQGLDVELVRAQVQRRLALRHLVELRGALQVTEADVQAEYARNPDRWRAGAQVSVQPYVARLVPGASGEEDEAVRQVAESFAAAVRNGESPAATAASHRMSVLPAFDLQPGSSEPALEAAAFGLPPQAWSAPVRTRAGWVVVRVNAREEGKLRSLEEVQAELRTLIEGRRRADAQSRLLAALRAQARIQVLVGNL